VPLLVPLLVPLEVPLDVPLDVPPLLLLPPLELPPPAITPPLLELLLLASSEASPSLPPELLELELDVAPELEPDDEPDAGAEASLPPGLLGELLEHATVMTRAARAPEPRRICCVRMRETYGGDPARATSQIWILSFPVRIR
jgi:hypothetical protein